MRGRRRDAVFSSESWVAKASRFRKSGHHVDAAERRGGDRVARRSCPPRSAPSTMRLRATKAAAKLSSRRRVSRHQFSGRLGVAVLGAPVRGVKLNRSNRRSRRMNAARSRSRFHAAFTFDYH